MTNIQSILNSQEAPNTLIMMSGEQLSKLIEDVTANTRRIVEEQYQPKYFTVEQMMEIFHVSKSTVYNWSKSGDLTSYKVGEGKAARIFFDQAEVREAVRAGRLGKYIHK